MLHRTVVRRWPSLVFLAALFNVIISRDAAAQGFISPSFGFNFSGDAGCRTATDCEDKNWNVGVSVGALGSFVGFEAEFVYENEFLGETTVAGESTKVLTVMGNFMLAPKISIVQPYGVAGIGLIRTTVENSIIDTSDDENQLGWTVGAGLIVYFNRHIGVKADVRHYHAFDALEILGIEFDRENKLDFGRAAFGAVFKF